MSLDGKTILVTGGTGSFGQKFAEIVLREHNPKALRIFSRGELLQDEMQKKFNDSRLRFLIGDVRDRERVYRAMKRVDVVVHAAALKQVPACEYNPMEAVHTNIIGTMNIINAAIDNQVERALALSTDKAVHPANLYGATKLVLERLFLQANVYAQQESRFSCVRYGNVVGSRGSVVPLFLEQRKTGVFTITDKRMTRFWITLDQGVHFVLKALERMQGGEIFVPKIPSMKIVDVADSLAPKNKKRLTGIRPGEKVHEALLTEEEIPHTRELEDCYIVEPVFDFWSEEKRSSGTALKQGFKYTSDTNDWWLSPEELRTMLGVNKDG